MTLHAGPKARRGAGLLGLGGAALALLFFACGGGGAAAIKTPTAPGGSKDPSEWPDDDKSMCDYRNKPDLQVSEVAGPGALKPNIRRVYKVFGAGDSENKSIVCREVDTNLDGIKDVVRTYNDKGKAVHEEADRDYDGRLDVWIDFVDGRMAEEHVDTDHDGKPDEWKYYTEGSLQRVKRDRNRDGEPDVWEIYAKGRLERIGVDETFDGHVDRWDRDLELKYEAEAKDREAREKLAAAEDGGTEAPDGGADDSGGPTAKN